MTPIDRELFAKLVLDLIDMRFCTEILTYDELSVLDGIRELLDLYKELPEKEGK